MGKVSKATDVVAKAALVGLVVPAFNVPYLPMVEPVIRAVVDQDAFALTGTRESVVD